MKDKINSTIKFDAIEKDTREMKLIFLTVYEALKEKGYDPVNQIVGYILSDDPTYITSYNNARSLIRKVERDILLEEIVRHYLQDIHEEG